MKQEEGPYKEWESIQEFKDKENNSTEITVTIHYELPTSGKIANVLTGSQVEDRIRKAINQSTQIVKQKLESDFKISSTPNIEINYSNPMYYVSEDNKKDTEIAKILLISGYQDITAIDEKVKNKIIDELNLSKSYVEERISIIGSKGIKNILKAKEIDDKQKELVLKTLREKFG